MGLYRGYIVIMEKEREAAIYGLGMFMVQGLGMFRVWG